MANRYWVGGTGTWNSSSTTNWSASSGGSSGASVPTAADSVFFDQAGTYTVTFSGTLTCLDITVSAGIVTFAGTGAPQISGSMSLLAGTVWSANGTITFNATTTGKTVTTNGVTLGTGITFNGVGGAWTLGSALTTNTITVTNGTFDTSSSGNYAVTCTAFSSNNSNVRTINLNGSTATLSGTTPINFTPPTNLTFNAGTSQINVTSTAPSFNANGVTFYNVSFTSATSTTISIAGANTFRDLTFTGRTSVGIGTATLSADQTINGTLTLGAGTAAAYRTFLASNTIGAPRTLTVNALAAGAADIDFRDITVTGSAAPLTGTRFGDCKGNSGITFPAAKTVYFRVLTNQNWGTSGTGVWSATSGGALDATQFPLAQDTAVFPVSPTPYPSTGGIVTINANYNIGTIDMSLRTSNTMTLTNGGAVPTIYGNWINGTGITISGSGRITFSGQTTQTITSAGKSFTQNCTIDAGSGSVTLQDAFSTASPSVSAILLTSGTFNANGYNVTQSSTGNAGITISGSLTRTLAIGSGTWTIAGTGGWAATPITNLTVTGTGTISLTSASAKTFAGGSANYSGITLNQGGAGDLTITGSNTFGNITNTVQPATVLFTAGTTSTFSNFSLSGTAGNLITIGSVTAASHTLSKASGTVSGDYLSISRSTATGGALWYAGANSTNGGNNTGWIFTAPPSGGYVAGGQFMAFF